MREIEEQAEKLMVQRVKEIREVYGMKASNTYEQELKEYVARMDRILSVLHCGNGSPGVISGWIPGCDPSADVSRNLKHRKSREQVRRGNAAAACSLTDK